MANQIKGNDECSNMQPHIQFLSLHTPLTTWMGSKVKKKISESSHVAYQIDGNGA